MCIEISNPGKGFVHFDHAGGALLFVVTCAVSGSLPQYPKLAVHVKRLFEYGNLGAIEIRVNLFVCALACCTTLDRFAQSPQDCCTWPYSQSLMTPWRSTFSSSLLRSSVATLPLHSLWSSLLAPTILQVSPKQIDLHHPSQIRYHSHCKKYMRVVYHALCAANRCSPADML